MRVHLIIVFTRGVLFISRPLRSSSQRAQRKTNLFFEKSLRRRFFKRTHASGGVLFAEREIFFDCRPLSGNQKLTILCDLCVLCERSSFVFGCDWAALRNSVNIILRPLISQKRVIFEMKTHFWVAWRPFPEPQRKKVAGEIRPGRHVLL